MAEHAKQEEPGVRRGVVWLLVFSLLTGCGTKPFARELEATMLAQVLGVDWSSDGVGLTAASEPGTGSGDAKASVLSADGKDFDSAQTALKAAGEEYVSLTHITQIVLGEGTDVSVVLKAALKEPALSQGATVWLTEEGTAKELMTKVKGGAKRLSSIELNSGVKPVTVLQGLMWLEERGWVEVPVLREEDGVLGLAGTVVIMEDAREA